MSHSPNALSTAKHSTIVHTNFGHQTGKGQHPHQPLVGDRFLPMPPPSLPCYGQNLFSSYAVLCFVALSSQIMTQMLNTTGFPTIVDSLSIVVTASPRH